MSDVEIVAATPAESGRDRIIVAPFQFYVDGTDHLRLTSANSLAGVIISVVGRFWDLGEQRIVPFQRDHTPNSDRTISRTFIPLSRGYILNAAVRVISGAPAIGQTFAILELVRGQTSVAEFLGVLAQDYVTVNQGLAWPGSPIRSSTEGQGFIRTFIGTDPAAGVEINETVPTGARWQLLSFQARFTTSAAVGARQANLFVTSGIPTSKGIIEPGTNQTAGISTIYTWANSGGGSLLTSATHVSNSMWGDLPNLAGDVIGTVVDGKDAADNWDAPRVTVREWLEMS